MDIPKVICHIDCNPDNFICLPDNTLKLIDWEYSGMCDRIIDISMYAIYSNYTKKQADDLLEIYLQRSPEVKEVIRFYSYMALGGFLWAIWTEYKQSFGVEFGDYGLKMYRYAKEYYAHVLSINLEKGSTV
jgi:thiamine kinase-like enzyme